MRGERGQITLFFIIGLVILLIFGILYLVVSFARSGEDLTDQGQRVLDTSQVAALNNHIGSCVDTIVNDELRILGETGALPAERGFPSALVGTGASQRAMLYGVTLNRDTPIGDGLRPFMLPVPEYPEPSVAVWNATIDPETGNRFAWFSDGFFGDVNFPPPCSKEGTNAPGTSRACRFYPGSPATTPRTEPTQDRLTQGILQRVQTCANIRQFEDILGQDITEIGTPSVEVTYTYTSTIVTLEFPLQLEGETQTKVGPFRRIYKVRYMPIAQYAIDLAREESKNLDFHILRDYKSIASHRAGFTVLRSDVEVTPQVTGITPPLNSKASLITIIDSQSEIDGASYTFSFLVEHRPPMLNRMEGVISCVAIDNTPLADLVSDGRISGADPDDKPVDFKWCHMSPSTLGPCPVFYQMHVIDEDGQTDWETTPCVRL